MLDPARAAVAGCSCPMCRRAEALDAMRRIEAARASARAPMPAPPEFREGPRNAVALAGLFYGVVLAGWLLLRAWPS